MRKYWIYIAVFCFLSSCAHIEEAKETKTPVSPPDIPSPVSFQIEKEKRVEAPRQEEVFSFSLREADMKDILRAIGKQAQYNIVVEPDVKGITTVDLKNVTLGKALEYILEPLGFTYKIEDHTIYVSKPKLETKIFHVNYISLKKEGTSWINWKSGGDSTAGSGGSTNTSQDKALEIINRTDADLWTNFENNLKSILSPDGKFIVNRHAFMIFITDYPKNLQRVSTFLEAIEGVIHRQIMIEAKIVEVRLDNTSKEGVNWKFIETRIGNFAKISGQQVLTAAQAPTQYFRFFVGSPESGQLDITNTFVELLKTQGEVKILSNPKIATLNNQRAVIKDTTQLVYFDTDQSGGLTSLATTKTKFMNIGIMLDVTPQIDSKDNIVLSIHPSYTLLAGYEASPDPNSRGRVPIVSTREADTVVRVKDGETVVIGGLIYERKAINSEGIQGLMSVPFLGALFRKKSDDLDRRELVVFLTPKIIYDKDN